MGVMYANCSMLVTYCQWSTLTGTLADEPTYSVPFAVTRGYGARPGFVAAATNEKAPSARTGLSPTESHPPPCRCWSVSSMPAGCGVTLPLITTLFSTTVQGDADAAILTAFALVAAPALPPKAKSSTAAASGATDRRPTAQSY